MDTLLESPEVAAVEPALFERADWYQAATLLERRAASERLRQQQSPLEIDDALAEERQKKWASQPTFSAG